MARRGRKIADEQLLLAIACGATVEAAARQFGICDRTVQRRLNDPGFRQRLQQMRADMVQRTTGMLSAAGMEAVKTLLELQQKSIGGSARLGAAKAILEIGMKMREVADFEQRLIALEVQAASSAASGESR